MWRTWWSAPSWRLSEETKLWGGGNKWYAWGQGYLLEEHRWAGETGWRGMGWQWLYEIQQGQMASLSPEKEELMMAETGSAWLGSSSVGKAPGGPGGHWAEHEPAVALAAMRANSILGCVSRRMACWWKAEIVPFYAICRSWAPSKRKILIRWSKVHQDGWGLESLPLGEWAQSKGYKWGRKTGTPLLMTLFIVFLIERRCLAISVAWKMYFHIGGSWDENLTHCRNFTWD